METQMEYEMEPWCEVKPLDTTPNQQQSDSYVDYEFMYLSIYLSIYCYVIGCCWAGAVPGVFFVLTRTWNPQPLNPKP